MLKTKTKPSVLPASLKDRLKKVGIRHFDELIHDQPKEWLIGRFAQGGGKYPVNVARLMRNLVWQMKERIEKKEKPPLKELVRTYWYMYVKPTLARAEALAEETDQYKQLVDNLAEMVKTYQLMDYKDIGFRDENEANRKVGTFANVIPFAEKLGHFDYLSDLYEQYHVSVIALGGQPSVMNSEYFVDDIKSSGTGIRQPFQLFSGDIKASKTNLRRSFYLFSIVDFDPSGWIIRDAFVNNLSHYGIKNTQVFELIHPDMLTPEEIMQSRYPIKAGKDMEEKNRRWYEEVSKRHYSNMKYLVEEKGKKLKLYGLEAEAVSTVRLSQKLKEIMEPIIGSDEGRLKIYEMNNLNQAVQELILFKVTHPEEVL